MGVAQCPGATTDHQQEIVGRRAGTKQRFATGATSAARAPRRLPDVGHAPTPASEQRGTKSICRLSLDRWRDVAVEVGEQRGVRVSQPFGGDLGRDGAGEHQRGACMAQAVGRQAGKACQHREVRQLPGKRLRVVRTTAGRVKT